jgi:poly-gamma-glutamate synthesis protein (capsule biosynthesis protein)
MIQGVKGEGDVVIVSIHWGKNWDFEITSAQRTFAHRLVDEAGVHIIHGHSSHHVKAVEVYKGSLVLYGCGDFLNDYEGIEGSGSFRGDLGLMYFAELDPLAEGLRALRMVPTQVRNFRVNRASEVDFQWLKNLLDREGERFGTWVERNSENALLLRWTE